MNNRNYSRKELIEADDKQFSFFVGVNLVNTSELVLQFPFELFKNTKKDWGRKKDVEIYQLFAAFQSIVNAVELLLKSRIALIDYKLLLKNTRDTSRESIINGDFQSVNFYKCIEVIEGNSSDIIPQNIKDRIDRLRIIRNKITHYYIETTHEMFSNYIAFGFDAYVTIYRDFIKEKIYDSYDRTEGFEEELSDFEEFVKIRVEKYKTPGNHECPVCYTWNLIIQEDKKEICLFCGYEKIEESAT